VDTTAAKVVLSNNVSGQETALIIESGSAWLINSGVLHIEASYILSSLLGGPMSSPAGADIVIADCKGLIFAEYDTDVDVNLPWNATTRVVRYSPDGDAVSDVAVDLQGSFSASMVRGELVILRSLFEPCCNAIRGNINDDPAQTIDISDLTFLVGYMFKSGPEPPCVEEGNVNGQGDIDISDLTYLVGYMFKSGPEPALCP
jgi:hypothetical protein